MKDAPVVCPSCQKPAVVWNDEIGVWLCKRCGETVAPHRNACDGHPAGPFDPMGTTVYCDGTCKSKRTSEPSAAGNERCCSHCSLPIVVEPSPPVERIAAFIAGFCGVFCQQNAARDVVARGAGWWQKGGAR